MRIIQYDWLIVLYISFPLVRIASFLIVKTVVSGKNSLMSTHFWFVHLPNLHFSLHLPPLQSPGICAVDNFQRFRFGSLPTSSQERVKQESTFTFTFTLRTIYDISKGVDLPLTMKKSSLSISHTNSHLLSLPSTGPLNVC